MLGGLSRTASFTLGTIAVIVATAAIALLGKSMIDGSNPEELDFWHAGYYRDASMDRMFTIGFNPAIGKAEVYDYAGQLMHSPGHVTTAYFYPADSRIPSGVLAGAASMAEARRAINPATGASPWRYAARKDENGQLRVVDCEAEPDESLCAP
jgi:hypothetical protein